VTLFVNAHATRRPVARAGVAEWVLSLRGELQFVPKLSAHIDLL